MDRETIAQIREDLSKAAPSELPSLIDRYRSDERAGVQALVAQADKRQQAAQDERERLSSLGALQRSLHAEGYAVVAGVDEVGRGALAGPVTAAAIVLPPDTLIEGVDDSKRLTSDTRTRLDSEIRQVCTCVTVTHVSADQVDQLGIAVATVRAMRQAIQGLDMPAEHVLVDGLPVELGLPSTAVVDGDASVAAIAAASIVAKVSRDRLMTELDAEYPGYGFTVNKGYGTPPHLEAIRQLGASAVHRRSFAPCVDQPTLF
jgi:ribonuclease HII